MVLSNKDNTTRFSFVGYYTRIHRRYYEISQVVRTHTAQKLIHKQIYIVQYDILKTSSTKRKAIYQAVCRRSKESFENYLWFVRHVTSNALTNDLLCIVLLLT